MKPIFRLESYVHDILADFDMQDVHARCTSGDENFMSLVKNIDNSLRTQNLHLCFLSSP